MKTNENKQVYAPESPDISEPEKCRHCEQIGQVTYYDSFGDSYCELCGKWQSIN